MELIAGFLLQIWREVSRHIEIAESMPRLAPLIRERLPADEIALIRLDTAHRRLEITAADRQRSPHPNPLPLAGEGEISH